MERFVSTGEAMRLADADEKRRIPDLLYNIRELSDACPVAGGRRLIPLKLIPRIREELAKRGWLKLGAASEAVGVSHAE
ncbi:MAG TPA: hypothetical protein VHQ47_07535 [Phycisphaerae bacterium]|nr:hypothetical protein [Phycisphaerae bacterium]